MTREQFRERFNERFYDLVCEAEREAMARIEAHRRNLTDWLEWMGLIDAGTATKLGRYIGYGEPCYNTHEALDKDKAVQEEARKVARSVVQAVKALRADLFGQPDKQVALRQAQGERFKLNGAGSMREKFINPGFYPIAVERLCRRR